MTEVVSIKFKTCGKSYFFSPGALAIAPGDRVVVETAKGLELAECSKGNHMVEDETVVQPLRAVVRVATERDLEIDEQNRIREKEAFVICRRKIEEHGLDMKLVGVECSFEGTKTLFFFTSDGRVDFRELVKDLAGIFHNRIELRQIGVRDEAKMVGGIGICGRPYCCSQFLEDFAPVSTKMAKVQSLSLNPAKISGSCGRLMCCLRYEEEAYENLVKKVPKQGAFVETIDGYGVATQVNLLRQTVGVSMDGDTSGNIRLFRAAEVAAVPGGRPPEGEPLPKVLNYVPEDEPEVQVTEPSDIWSTPNFFAEELSAEDAPQKSDNQETEKEESTEGAEASKKRYRPRRGNRRGKRTAGAKHTAPKSGENAQKAGGEVKKAGGEVKKPAGENAQKPIKKKPHSSNRRYFGKNRSAGKSQKKDSGE